LLHGSTGVARAPGTNLSCSAHHRTRDSVRPWERIVLTGKSAGKRSTDAIVTLGRNALVPLRPFEVNTDPDRHTSGRILLHTCSSKTSTLGDNCLGRPSESRRRTRVRLSRKWVAAHAVQPRATRFSG